jgi:hypothetical protein
MTVMRKGVIVKDHGFQRRMLPDHADLSQHLLHGP